MTFLAQLAIQNSAIHFSKEKVLFSAIKIVLNIYAYFGKNKRPMAKSNRLGGHRHIE